MKRFVTAFGLMLAAATLSTQVMAADTKKTLSGDELAPQVQLDELKKIVNDKSATIIDANGTDMYDAGHVPGALSFARNEGKLAGLLPKDKNALVVSYCGGPMCTAWEAAAKEAKELGYTNLKHFKGGIKGWKDAGLPVETAAKKAS